MSNQGVSKSDFPQVAVWLLMHVFNSFFLNIIVVQSENIFTHADNIKKAFCRLMINQAQIDHLSDQGQKFGLHASLHI